MSDSPKNFDPGGPAEAEASSATAPADFSALFNFPSLGRLFEGTDAEPLREMRARLERTRQELERVIRQGSKEDAERASQANEAYQTTLALFDKLEEIRRQRAS